MTECPHNERFRLDDECLVCKVENLEAEIDDLKDKWGDAYSICQTMRSSFLVIAAHCQRYTEDKK